MAEEAKDATAVVARAPPGDPKSRASAGARTATTTRPSPPSRRRSSSRTDRRAASERAAVEGLAAALGFVAHFPDHFREEVLGQACGLRAWSKADLNRPLRRARLVALAETLGLEIAVWSTLFEGDAPLVYKPWADPARAPPLQRGPLRPDRGARDARRRRRDVRRGGRRERARDPEARRRRRAPLARRERRLLLGARERRAAPAAAVLTLNSCFAWS